MSVAPFLPPERLIYCLDVRPWRKGAGTGNNHKRRSPAKNAAPAEPHYFSDRLKCKLKQLRDFPAVIVETPSGYGKTTAIQDYLDSAVPQSADVYWFTAVDEAPDACYRRFCREIERVDGRAGERLAKLDFPNAFTIDEICEVLRTIECNREAWLVIDNFQFLCAGLPSAFLTALIEHGASELHIVIVTQTLNRDVHAAIAGCRFLHVTPAYLRLDDEDIRRYYALAGVDITEQAVQQILLRTNGWIIAVYLQLCAYRETGAFSDAAVPPLMEKLVWGKLTVEQQTFFLRLSPFEAITARQICGLLGCDELPRYALHAATFKDELPPDLTAREHEIAQLAAKGLHNSEIASKLFVTESTVRTHLRTIFQKLDIDRKTKLAEKLK